LLLTKLTPIQGVYICGGYIDRLLRSSKTKSDNNDVDVFIYGNVDHRDIIRQINEIIVDYEINELQSPDLTIEQTKHVIQYRTNSHII